MKDTTVAAQFGARLKTLRESVGISQTELARRVHLSKTIIARWEKGETSPTLDNVNRIAEFFKVTLSEMVGEGPDQEAALRAAEALLQQWTPALAAIKQAVHAAAQKKET